MEDFSDLIPEKKKEPKFSQDYTIWGTKALKEIKKDIDQEIMKELWKAMKKAEDAAHQGLTMEEYNEDKEENVGF